jgi:hypothetical protein
VHKDKLIVYFVTLLMTSMFSKLFIATASQWNYLESNKDSNEYINAQEINCGIFVYDHVPQVFLVLVILVVYFKTALYEGALTEN